MVSVTCGRVEFGCKNRRIGKLREVVGFFFFSVRVIGKNRGEKRPIRYCKKQRTNETFAHNLLVSYQVRMPLCKTLRLAYGCVLSIVFSVALALCPRLCRRRQKQSQRSICRGRVEPEAVSEGDEGAEQRAEHCRCICFLHTSGSSLSVCSCRCLFLCRGVFSATSLSVFVNKQSSKQTNNQNTQHYQKTTARWVNYRRKGRKG